MIAFRVRFTKFLAFLALAPMLAGAQEIGKTGNARTLLVTGNGEAAAAPDQAVVRLGASVQLEQADAAQAKVSETMQGALAAIEKLNVPRKAIRTANLTLTPVYAQQRSSTPVEPRVVAYRAANTIEVTLADIKLVGKVIDAGISAGANELQGVAFGLQNDDGHRLTALSSAAEEAQIKARTIARALDVKLGGIIEVTEGGVHVITPRNEFAGARMMMARADMATPVEPGEVKIQASVTVRYEIKP